MAEKVLAPLSLGQVLRRGFSQYLAAYGPLSMESYRVVNAIINCRSEAGGVHRTACPECGHVEIAYNSCRNRHCPRCQSYKAKQWVVSRSEELLSLPYFHLVFTIPHELNHIALQNKQCFYTLLFRAVSETLLCLAADKKRLGGQVGFFAVLHTWTQTLIHHPHVHVVIAGGGIAHDKKRFKRSRPDYLFPVKVLSCLFRGKLLSFFKDAVKKGNICFYGSLSELHDLRRLQQLLDTVYHKDFVVYAKKAFSTAAQVVEYLGRYTHRVAISDRRILGITQDRVIFQWRDRSDNNASKVMCLQISEFIRRFLLHLLPAGFVKIRYYGFMANAVRKQALLLCRKLLSQHDSVAVCAVVIPQRQDGGRLCPCCAKAYLVFDGVIMGRGTG